MRYSIPAINKAICDKCGYEEEVGRGRFQEGYTYSLCIIRKTLKDSHLTDERMALDLCSFCAEKFWKWLKKNNQQGGDIE